MPDIELYVFDMDHTLIGMDSDHGWKFYAEEAGIVASGASAKADQYLADYAAGKLDSEEFIAFQYAEFVGKTPAEATCWMSDYFAKTIRPTVYKDAFEYVAKLRSMGASMAILSSTADVIVKAPGNYFAIDTLIGTRLEVVDNRYTGKVAGVYALREGKAAALANFCRQKQLDPARCAYFGDSINDRFVMEQVGFAFAVNPDRELEALAGEKNWTILNWK